MSEFDQVWPSEFCDQQEYIEDLLAFINDIDNASRSVFLYQPTEPNAAQLQAAWDDQVGAAFPINPGAKIFWYDTTRQVIDNVWETTYDLTGVSSGTLYKVWDKRKTLDIGVIDDQLLEDDLSTTISINPLSQDWSNLMCFVVNRTNTAGVPVCSLQSQVVGGVHMSHIMDVTGTPAVVAADTVATLTSFATTIAAPNSTASPFSYEFRTMWIPNYTETLRDKNLISNGSLYTGALPVAAANRRMTNVLSGRNTVGAVTALTLLNGGVAMKQGTRLTVYGMR